MPLATSTSSDRPIGWPSMRFKADIVAGYGSYQQHS